MAAGGEAGGPPPEQLGLDTVTTEPVREVLQSGQTREVWRREQLENDRLEQDLRLRSAAFGSELALRQRYAKRLLAVMIVQLFVANAVFIGYAQHGFRWVVPADVMKTWLAATVVQVVGVVAVVTRHLFPARTKEPADP